jgi:hypothetical protein
MLGHGTGIQPRCEETKRQKKVSKNKRGSGAVALSFLPSHIHTGLSLLALPSYLTPTLLSSPEAKALCSVRLFQEFTFPLNFV